MLVALVTLVCCYAACWGPTKRHCDADVRSFGGGGEIVALAPLVVRTAVYGQASHVQEPLSTTHHYYVWFFGYVRKVPFYEHIDHIDDTRQFSINY